MHRHNKQKRGGGDRVLKDASTLESRLDSRDVPIFDVFILAGLVPPMSEFCHAVIATYALHLLHLHPHAVALLAIFQHFCEGFVGIVPSVALFRHFFYPFVETAGAVSGCVDFRLREEVDDDFFKLGLKEEWGE